MRCQYLPDEGAIVVLGERSEWSAFGEALAAGIPVLWSFEPFEPDVGRSVAGLVIADIGPDVPRRHDQAWLSAACAASLVTRLEDLLAVNDANDFALPGWHAHAEVDGEIWEAGRWAAISELTISGPDPG